MPDLSILISLLAFFVSVSSLSISALSFFRDRNRLVTWSSVQWSKEGPFDAPKDKPVLHILILNAGRRPISITNLVKRSGRSVWSRSVKRDIDGSNPSDDLHTYIDELRRNAVAHISSIRLNEGEIYEMVFQTSDSPEFFATHTEQPLEARTLYIEDVQGKRYQVRDSGKNLKILISAWNPDDD